MLTTPEGATWTQPGIIEVKTPLSVFPFYKHIPWTSHGNTFI